MKSTKTTAPQRLADARAIAQLSTAATLGVTKIVKGVHQAVLDKTGRAGQPVAKVTHWVYQIVQAITQSVGKTLDVVLNQLEAQLKAPEVLERLASDASESQVRDKLLAALNGVTGDFLKAHGNSLAIEMSLRLQGQAIDPAQVKLAKPARAKLVVLVHGLCMNDQGWQTQVDEVSYDHGVQIARGIGANCLYLRYNSGLPIADNGEQLCALLAELVEHWPQPLESLSLVAHSMGGLVCRQAIHTATQNKYHWLSKLKAVVFLGTPHLGAPLEKGGSWIELLLGSNAFSQPFLKLTQLRSAGIQDLRNGIAANSLASWPSHTAFFAIAASLGKNRQSRKGRLVGDGLVPIASALGKQSSKHSQPAASLPFESRSTWVAYETGHMELLSNAKVGAKIIQFLARSK